MQNSSQRQEESVHTVEGLPHISATADASFHVRIKLSDTQITIYTHTINQKIQYFFKRELDKSAGLHVKENKPCTEHLLSFQVTFLSMN